MRRSPGGLEVSSGRYQELGDRTAPSGSLTPQTVLRVGQGPEDRQKQEGEFTGSPTGELSKNWSQPAASLKSAKRSWL